MADLTLEEIQEKRAALAATAAEKATAAQEAALLKAEMIALSDDESRASMTEKFGPGGFAEVATLQGAIFLRPPAQAVFKRFQDEASFKYDDLLKFVQPCVEIPPLSEFNTRLAALPAVLVRCSGALLALAGSEATELQKKY